MGDTKDSERYNRSLQYEREPVRIRRMTDTKDRSGTKELKSYGRKKLPLCEAASVTLLQRILGQGIKRDGKWKMGKRTKKRGVKAYIAIVCLVLLLAAGALASGYRDRQLREQETLPEQWVELAEIKEELSFGVYGQEDWNSFFRDVFRRQADRGNTGRTARKAAAVRLHRDLRHEGIAESVKGEDWNYVYGQILDLLDMEYAVTKTEFLVVDVMEAENQNVIMTNKGDFCTVLPASYFKQWNGYEGYCVENRCIGARGNAEEGIYAGQHISYGLHQRQRGFSVCGRGVPQGDGVPDRGRFPLCMRYCAGGRGTYGTACKAGDHRGRTVVL